MIILDGITLAQQREATLREKVDSLPTSSSQPTIAAVLFTEDPGSVLYTSKKSEAAQRVGMGYQIFPFSMLEEISVVQAQIQSLNDNPQITGIIIQKPTRKIWQDVYRQRFSGEELSKLGLNFNAWWMSLISEINPHKDVDGLHPSTLKALQENTWQEEGKVLPATCRAVISLLEEADQGLHSIFQSETQFVILGKSDLLGQPLFYYLKNQDLSVSLIGSKDLARRQEMGTDLHDTDVVISATGRPNLITGGMLKPGCVVIDVGEPQGDVDFESVKDKVAVITPVPGGVGPMTVVCLLENCYQLFISHN